MSGHLNNFLGGDDVPGIERGDMAVPVDAVICPARRVHNESVGWRKHCAQAPAELFTRAHVILHTLLAYKVVNTASPRAVLAQLWRVPPRPAVPLVEAHLAWLK